jgi:hypothetical protein
VFPRGKPSPLRFDLERAANLTDYDAREQFPQCDSIRRVGPVLAQMWQGWAQSRRRSDTVSRGISVPFLQENPLLYRVMDA